MSQDYSKPSKTARQAFPEWLFGRKSSPGCFPWHVSPRRPASPPRPVSTLHSPARTGPPPRTWTSGFVPSGFRAANKWRDCAKCRDIDDTPTVGCNLGVRSGRLWRGAPSVDRCRRGSRRPVPRPPARPGERPCLRHHTAPTTTSGPTGRCQPRIDHGAS